MFNEKSWIVFVFFFKEGAKQINIESVIMIIPANSTSFGELKKIDNLMRRDHWPFGLIMITDSMVIFLPPNLIWKIQFVFSTPEACCKDVGCINIWPALIRPLEKQFTFIYNRTLCCTFYCKILCCTRLGNYKLCCTVVSCVVQGC